MSQQIWNTSHRNSQSSLLTDSIQSSYVNVGGCRMWKNVLNNKNAELHFIICLWLSSLFNILSPYHLPQPRFNQRIMPSIFEIKICQDLPWHYERLQINSQSLRSVILITNKIELVLAKNGEKGAIYPSWKLWGKMFLFVERTLYCHSHICPRESLNLGREQWAKFNRLILFSGTMER